MKVLFLLILATLVSCNAKLLNSETQKSLGKASAEPETKIISETPPPADPATGTPSEKNAETSLEDASTTQTPSEEKEDSAKNLTLIEELTEVVRDNEDKNLCLTYDIKSFQDSQGNTLYCNKESDCSVEIEFVNNFEDKMTAFKNYQIIQSINERNQSILDSHSDTEVISFYTSGDSEENAKLQLFLQEALKVEADLKSIIDYKPE